jgi:hypothetical protein
MDGNPRLRFCSQKLASLGSQHPLRQRLLHTVRQSDNGNCRTAVPQISHEFDRHSITWVMTVADLCRVQIMSSMSRPYARCAGQYVCAAQLASQPPGRHATPSYRKSAGPVRDAQANSGIDSPLAYSSASSRARLRAVWDSSAHLDHARLSPRITMR